jgi:hypothetical protein
MQDTPPSTDPNTPLAPSLSADGRDGPPYNWLARVLLAALTPAGLGLQRAAGDDPQTVEQVFSLWLYPSLGGRLGCVFDWLPFSVAEVVIAVLLTGAALRIVQVAVWVLRRRISIWGSLLRLLGDGLAIGGMAYLGFLLAWGLNYQRQPFARAAGLELGPAPVSELELLSVDLVEEANRLRLEVAEEATGVMRLRSGLQRTLARASAGFRAASRRYPTLAGRCLRPKPVAASVVLSYLGISGVYFPFTGEANVNASVPPPLLPFSASHELAHQIGFAREDEANYLAYLACRSNPSPDYRYSGALAASGYALTALAGADRTAYERVNQRRSAAVGRDLKAVADWTARYRGRVSEASKRVNDAYLRTQGQRDGVASYGRMVDLLLAERRAREAETQE